MCGDKYLYKDSLVVNYFIAIRKTTKFTHEPWICSTYLHMNKKYSASYYGSNIATFSLEHYLDEVRRLNISMISGVKLNRCNQTNQKSSTEIS